jgi:hypothetical protein
LLGPPLDEYRSTPIYRGARDATLAAQRRQKSEAQPDDCPEYFFASGTSHIKFANAGGAQSANFTARHKPGANQIHEDGQKSSRGDQDLEAVAMSRCLPRKTNRRDRVGQWSPVKPLQVDHFQAASARR